MSTASSSSSPLPVHAALCIDQNAFDRLGSVLRHLAVGLVDQAIHLRLLSCDERVSALALGPIQFIRHERASWLSANRRITGVVEALAPQAPTIVHAFSVDSYELAAAIAEVYEAELVVQVTTLADCDGVAKMGDARTSKFVTFSEPLVKVLEDQLRLPADRIELIRPGILAGERIACFSRPGREATLLCTSSFERESGVDQLIEAMDLLRQRGHPVLAFLLGSGRGEHALRRAVLDRGLSAHVTFARPLGDPADAMRSADLFVRPSVDESFTVDSLQAMACGMVVVTCPNGICDYLRHDETAVLCAEPTGGALADVMEQLLSDRPYATRVASAGMEYIRTHHTMSAMAEGTAGLYRKLALERATFPIAK